jgi:predicted O-methyltransferase YrrM
MPGSRITQRLAGLPRSIPEVNRSLQHLANLRELGWHESVGCGASVDADGGPLPWYTYPCIEWLAARLKGDDKVFEFGAGSSTLWYAARVRRVVSVEHDRAWYSQLIESVPENVELHLHHIDQVDKRSLNIASDPYVNCIKSYLPLSFDVIVVDGVHRPTCSMAAITHLKEDGLLILDNSDRPAYRSAIEQLADHGLGRIDFYGFAPGSGILGCTSVFARSFERWVTARSAIRTWGL